MVTTRHNGQAWDQVELRPTELQRQHRTHDRLAVDAAEIRPAERDGHEVADGNADQHGNVLQKSARELNHQQDDEEHQSGDQQIAGRSEVRLPCPATRPIDADPHQHHADHRNDRAGDHRRKEAQHVFDERRDTQAENAADQNRAVDSGQSDARHGRHRQHRRDRYRGHAHDDGQTDAERPEADRLDQGRYSARKQVGVDQ